jgi:FkbM family methyltransferase
VTVSGQPSVPARRQAVEVLKRIRAWPPLNAALTTSVRAGLRALHVRSEFAATHLPRVGTTRARLPNGRTLILRAAGDDWVSNRVFWYGWSGYEPECSALFFALARQARGTLDVGAHVGYYALLAAHANPAGRVIAFEPVDVTRGRLTRNLGLNRAGNVTVDPRAVAAANGRRAFHVPVGAGIPSHAGFDAGGEDTRPVETTAVRLDDALRDHAVGPIDLVKLDVEGSEPEVLAGMPETLARDRPDILCEVLPWADTAALERVLAPHGYRYHQLLPGGPVARAHLAGDPVWFNYLFSARQVASGTLHLATRSG